MRISDWSSDVCSSDLGVFANVAQVIFDGGRLASQVRSQRAATDAAFAAYKQAALSALEDVENAMVSLSSARARKAEFARSAAHTSELQSLMRNSYAVFCLKKKRASILQIAKTEGI